MTDSITTGFNKIISSLKISAPKRSPINSKDNTSPLIKKLSPYFVRFWLFAYILFFIALSQLSLRYNPRFGVYLDGLAIAALIGLTIYYEKGRKISISAAIIPMATMIVLLLPRMANITRIIIFYDIILIFGLIYRYIFLIEDPAGMRRGRLKLINYVIFIPLMAILGQILGVIGYLMLKHHFPFIHVSLPFLALTAGVFAFTEETYFRGLVQLRAGQVIHPVFAALLSIILFVLVTIGHLPWMVQLFALILGTVLSVTYYFKQNLVLTGTTNLVTKLVYVGLMAAFVFR